MPQMTLGDVAIVWVCLLGLFALAVILRSLWRGLVWLWSELLNGAAYEIN